jgi:hypothetical protein
MGMRRVGVMGNRRNDLIYQNHIFHHVITMIDSSNHEDEMEQIHTY